MQISSEYSFGFSIFQIDYIPLRCEKLICLDCLSEARSLKNRYAYPIYGKLHILKSYNFEDIPD